MSDLQTTASTRAIPRQLAIGILKTLGVIVVAAAILVRMMPTSHGPTIASPAAALAEERIAPVARVEISRAVPEAAPASEPVAAAAAPAPAVSAHPVPAAAAAAPAAPAVSAAAAKPAAVAVTDKPATTPAATTPAAPAGKSGEQVYQATCSVCHASGVAGAPKVGDKAAWAPRIAGGLSVLGKSAMTGKGAMPARGGNPNLSEAEVMRAVIYMANQSGAAFKEPAAAAAAPATAPAAKPAEKPAEKPAIAAPTAAATPAPARAPAPRSEPPALAVKAEAAAPRIKGEAIYQKTCAACHATGVAGAPKIGDIAAWGPRIASGADAMMKSALNGKGAMPPRGGNAKLSDAEVRAALEYMLGQFR